MALNYKLKLVVLLLLISVCVISGNTNYKCNQKTPETKCTVLDVTLNKKVDFGDWFTLVFKQPSRSYSYYYDVPPQEEYEYELNFINSSINYIPRSLFTSLSNLNKLNMIECGLIEISPYDFMNAGNLKWINLSHNALTELIYMAFNGASNLIEINLAHNNIAQIDSGAFKNLQNLRKFDLSSNQIATITKDTFGTLKLDELNLNENKITVIDAATISFLHVTKLSLDYNQITELNISNEYIEQVSLNNNAIGALNVTPDTNLKSLYADNNLIRHLNIIDDQHKLEKLSLANNSLVSMDFIKILTGLKHLDLSYNPLSGDRIESDTFKQFTNLQSIYLAEINLHHFDLQPFLGAEKLRILDVSRNNFQTLNFDGCSTLSNLKQLYINGNSLNQLGAAELTNLFLHVDLIDISDNDLQCHNMFQIFEKLKQINKKNSLESSLKNLVIRGVACQNPVLDSGIQNNTNYYYMELDKIQTELGTMKTENANLKSQLADVMAAYNTSVIGMKQTLLELTDQVSALNETFQNEIDSKIMKTVTTLGNDLSSDRNFYNYSKIISKDDGKVVNILIV